MCKKLLLMFMLAGSLSLTTFSLVGCNTVHGVGEDTERAGEHIQHAADENR